MKKNNQLEDLHDEKQVHICKRTINIEDSQYWVTIGIKEKYCFLSKYFNPLHTFTTCREDLIGVLRAGLININYFGLVTYKRKKKLYTKKTRLAVTKTKKFGYFNSRVENNLAPFIHAIEDQYGITRTKFYLGTYCDRSKNKYPIVVIDGDSRWMHAPPLMSLYTLLIRIGLSSYAKGNKKNFMSIIEKYYKSKYNFIKGDYLGTIDLLLKNDVKTLFYYNQKNNYKYSYLTRCGLNTFHIYLSDGPSDKIGSAISHWLKKALWLKK